DAAETTRKVDGGSVEVAFPCQHWTSREADAHIGQHRVGAARGSKRERRRGGSMRIRVAEHDFVAERLDHAPATLGNFLVRDLLEAVDDVDDLVIGKLER